MYMHYVSHLDSKYIYVHLVIFLEKINIGIVIALRKVVLQVLKEDYKMHVNIF
jgi:hypothetical protein